MVDARCSDRKDRFPLHDLTCGGCFLCYVQQRPAKIFWQCLQSEPGEEPPVSPGPSSIPCATPIISRTHSVAQTHYHTQLVNATTTTSLLFVLQAPIVRPFFFALLSSLSLSLPLAGSFLFPYADSFLLLLSPSHQVPKVGK